MACIPEHKNTSFVFSISIFNFNFYLDYNGNIFFDTFIKDNDFVTLISVDQASTKAHSGATEGSGARKRDYGTKICQGQVSGV